jgi:hypothetical protein
MVATVNENTDRNYALHELYWFVLDVCSSNGAT